VDVDYDTYAKAEAELGWYNGLARFKADNLDAYELGSGVLRHLAAECDLQDIAHAKVLVRSGRSAVKMSLVLSNLTVDGARGSRYMDGEVEMYVNGRIVSPPEKLKAAIQKAVRKAMADAGVEKYDLRDECFAPGRPEPTYRMRAEA